MPAHRLTDDMTWEEITEKIMRESDEPNNNKFRKWLLSKKRLGGYFFNSILWNNCFEVYKKINFTDDDHFYMITGKEGVGKSTLAQQIACVIDPTFNRSRIMNDQLKWFKWLRHDAKRGQAVILDEGNLFLFSRDAMKSGNINTIKLITLMRQANLCLIICVPKFETIDNYIRTHRVDSLIRITQKHQSFTYYTDDAIRIINKCLKKGMEWNDIKIPYGDFFEGYWNKFLPNLNDINFDKYKDEKWKTWTDFLDESIGMLKQKSGDTPFITIQQAQRIVPYSTQSYIKQIKEKKIKGMQVGSRWFINKDDFLKNIAGIPPHR